MTKHEQSPDERSGDGTWVEVLPFAFMALVVVATVIAIAFT